MEPDAVGLPCRQNMQVAIGFGHGRKHVAVGDGHSRQQQEAGAQSSYDGLNRVALTADNTFFRGINDLEIDFPAPHDFSPHPFCAAPNDAGYPIHLFVRGQPPYLTSGVVRFG